MLIKFKIAIQGQGATVADCWRDACEAFGLEPGPHPRTDFKEIPPENCELFVEVGAVRD